MMLEKNFTCDIILAFSDNTLAASVCADLNAFGNDDAKLTVEDLQSFANCESMESRSLIALCMGSYVHEGGVKGIGASKINDILSKLHGHDKESVNKELIDLLIKKFKTD